jgi:hypothetical protein
MRNKINMMKLSQKDLKESKAGDCCRTENCDCACWYAGTPGGSSTLDNCGTNAKGGLHSPELNPLI